MNFKTVNLKTMITLIIIIAGAAGLSGLVKADPVKKGLEIAKLVDKHDQGWKNSIASVEMVLRNKRGQESKRKMKIKTLEVSGDGDKSLTIFKSPRDIKGTAFLSFTHPTTADDQWLYLPALKRVKRISSHNKSGPFMGSEFAYEDISSQEVEKYTYKFIRDEKVAGFPGHVIERYPVDKNSGYTKQIVWLDTKDYKVHKIEFYDRKGAKLKTLMMENYKKYLTDTWRPLKMSVVNHLNGKSTDLIWKEYKFNNSISERDFDKNALKRVR
jgi:outer membrane lipoprotein-sorting protein